MQAPATAPETPIGSEKRVLEAARSLRPLLEACADEIEHTRQLPPRVIDAMAAAGLFTMLVPRELGGGQVSPETCMRVIEEIARADGSAGWCLNVAVVVSAAAGTVPLEVASRVWGHNPKAYVAGSFVGSGTAVVEDGGYRVSGRWAFASGCQHATFLAGVASVMEDGAQRRGPNGLPETRMVFMPRDQCEIIDTWHVAGMRGTGSHDFVVDSAFVPEVFVVPRSFAIPRHHPAPLYAYAAGAVPGANTKAENSPWVGLSSSGMAAVLLGIARGAMDAFIELAAVKTPTRRATLLCEDPVVEAQIGRAEAKLRAARALLYATIHEVWEAVVRTGAGAPNDQTMLRLASVHAAETAIEVVETLWRAAGTSAIFNTSVLDRRLRDVQVGGQNVTISPMYFGDAGRLLLTSAR